VFPTECKTSGTPQKREPKSQKRVNADGQLIASGGKIFPATPSSSSPRQTAPKIKPRHLVETMNTIAKAHQLIALDRKIASMVRHLTSLNMELNAVEEKEYRRPIIEKIKRAELTLKLDKRKRGDSEESDDDSDSDEE